MLDNKGKITEFLEDICFPFSRKNIIESGFAKSILEKNGVFYILLDGEIGKISNAEVFALKNKIESGILVKFGLKSICIVENLQESDKPSKQSSFSGSFLPINGVRKTICVISGKGGVGKTSVSLSIAHNLQKNGFKTGICDLDIYGPSIPSFLKISHKHEFSEGLILPFLFNGIEIASIGMMIESNEPIIWRGAMLSKAINQLIREVKWVDLDYLVIDTPPGTGDVHLSLLQNFPIDTVFAVTTNDEISVKNTIKSVNMFRKLSKPVDFAVVNMAFLEKNGQKISIFGETDFAKKNMQNLDINRFIEVPIFEDKNDILNFNLEI